ncbi:TPA: helix-turn-helix transcriptional regulator [Streptococcus suis]|uniref:helix-turn-helix transcriptional regulator n=1 Tax=Streptococcus suis TaxID=1307 RepID=UPI0009434424|nr:helix-turn-helix transcriptional regulator [Streptococcus suis]RRN54660.1 XRE family transcriptional regulator [Streptococcus suis]HEL1563756.1 helix-turn-helix transcriptional regulator [Streptococcus suis]HEL1698456.1 helix-turn-helix transcriptional regulator [Streptococcus suis]HEL1763092.1 helix-turn-helix transcriptional regulator [Streptococcus suis]HEL1792994.1 helix-turn-helix transcriptional regulator [Streptococcus suis]
MKRFNGAKVRELREKKGWSQQFLGDCVNINQRTISDIELNRNKTELEEWAILAFSKVFCVSKEFFFDDAENIITNYKPSGSRNYRPAFKLHKMKLSDIRELTKARVDVFNGSYYEIDDYLEVFDDAEVKAIRTELAQTITSYYRNNDLIDEDTETESVIVLEVEKNG